MKRTIILLDENLLLEIQQMAKDQDATASQVIQQALVQYCQGQRSGRSHGDAGRASPGRSASQHKADSAVEAQPGSPASRSQHGSGERRGQSGARSVWQILLSTALGALAGLFAASEFVRAASQFAGGEPPLQWVVTHIVPGALLTVIAGAFFFIALRSLRRAAT